MQSADKLPPLPALTGLRFFAALFVFISHSLSMLLPLNELLNDKMYYNFQRLSGIGMSLFFVLSGFVIHYNYSQSIREDKTRGLYNFFVARFARLYPLFFACIIWEVTSEWGRYNNETNPYLGLIYYLTMTQSWFYSWLGHHELIYQFKFVGAVSWSISTEWFFYIAYPFIAFLIYRATNLRSKFLLLFFTLVIGIVWVASISIYRNQVNSFGVQIFGSLADFATNNQESFYRWLIYFSPYSRIIEFILGCLTASIFMHLHYIKPTKNEQIMGKAFVSISFILLLLSYHYLFNPPPSLWWLQAFHQNFGFAISLALIIFCSARYNNYATQFLGNKYLVLGGELSYSMYLFHLTLISYVSRYKVAPTNYINIAYCIGLMFVSFLLLMICSFLSYKLYEVPARRIIRNQFNLRRVPIITVSNTN